MSDVETSLRDSFSFDARDFGQPVSQSEVIAVIQSVPGVTAVDLDKLYRSEALPAEQVLNDRLFADPPQPGSETPAAELLTLDPSPLDGLEVAE